jgi:hypothetical protein
MFILNYVFIVIYHSLYNYSAANIPENDLPMESFNEGVEYEKVKPY